MINIIWNQVEKFYGKSVADRMKDSKWLKGVTVTAILPNGKEASYEDLRAGRAEFDWPQEDLDRAYRDVSGLRVHAAEWD